MYNPQTLENIWIFSTFKRNHETTLAITEVEQGWAGASVNRH